MTSYAIFESVVIALIVGWSVNRVVRQYAPARHASLRRTLAAFFGVKVDAVPVNPSGCGSGCGTCASGCESPADNSRASNPSAGQEQALHFHPRKH